MKPELRHTHITAKQRWFDIDLHELWQYRDLIRMFVKKDFALIYKQTILGPAWIFLTPLLTTIIYTVVFGNIANLDTNGTPKLLFYMTGNALWSFFAYCLTKTSSTFRDNAAVFGKVYFPRLTKPISTVLSAAINFFAQMLMVTSFWLYYVIKDTIHPHWCSMLLLPFLLLILGTTALGCGIIVSSLTTKYRDLSIVVSFGVSLWMYATPVVYPLSTATDGWMRTLLFLNPITQMMEAFRYMLLGEGEISIWGILWSIVFAFLSLFLGILLFNKIEKTFMDTV